MKRYIIPILLFITILATAQEVKVFFKPIALGDLDAEPNLLTAFEESDLESVQKRYRAFLDGYFKEVTAVRKNIKATDTRTSADMIVSTEVKTFDDSNIAFTLTSVYKDDPESGTSQDFMINIYEDPDDIQFKLKYNTKSALYGLFDFYWVKVNLEAATGISGVAANRIKEMIERQMFKTKKAFFFDPDKNIEIANRMGEGECLETECESQAAPFLYFITVTCSKEKDSITVSSKMLKTINGEFRRVTQPLTKTFKEKELLDSINENKDLKYLTEIALALMDVDARDLVNEDLKDIRYSIKTMKGAVNRQLGALDARLDGMLVEVDTMEALRVSDKASITETIGTYKSFVRTNQDAIGLIERRIIIMESVFGGTSGVFLGTGFAFMGLFLNLQLNTYQQYLALTTTEAAAFYDANIAVQQWAFLAGMISGFTVGLAAATLAVVFGVLNGIKHTKAVDEMKRKVDDLSLVRKVSLLPEIGTRNGDLALSMVMKLD
jgi:hypothetical protein